MFPNMDLLACVHIHWIAINIIIKYFVNFVQNWSYPSAAPKLTECQVITVSYNSLLNLLDLTQQISVRSLSAIRT